MRAISVFVILLLEFLFIKNALSQIDIDSVYTHSQSVFRDKIFPELTRVNDSVNYFNMLNERNLGMIFNNQQFRFIGIHQVLMASGYHTIRALYFNSDKKLKALQNNYKFINVDSVKVNINDCEKFYIDFEKRKEGVDYLPYPKKITLYDMAYQNFEVQKKNKIDYYTKAYELITLIDCELNKIKVIYYIPNDNVKIKFKVIDDKF